MDIDTAANLRAVINRLARRLNASATHQGLTPARASALGIIAARESVSLSELTAIEGLNPTMVSRVVGRLDEDGLIRRVQNPLDLRAGLVEITPLGTEVNARVQAERASVIADCLDRLPVESQAAIIAVIPHLEALASELRTASDGERP